MGRLIEGRWSTEWYSPDEEGRFQREATRFRDRIVSDGSTPYAPDAGRYHLYVSYACPWAHRTLVVRALRGLERAVSVSVVHPIMTADGWGFDADHPDAVGRKPFLRDVYLAAQPGYTGRVTVPVLWDKQLGRIVNNESREIIRMMSRALAPLGDRGADLCPPELEAAIDREIDRMYAPVNNGVYRAGFATTQRAYDEAVGEVFAALDDYERALSRRRWLVGHQPTEADVCLFTTLVRFDAVYHYHFKCNLRRLRDYPSLWGFVRDVYQLPGVRETVDLRHIKEHYFRSHERVNPTRVVPVGPELDFEAPPGRGRLE